MVWNILNVNSSIEKQPWPLVESRPIQNHSKILKYLVNQINHGHRHPTGRWVTSLSRGTINYFWFWQLNVLTISSLMIWFSLQYNTCHPLTFDHHHEYKCLPINCGTWQLFLLWSSFYFLSCHLSYILVFPLSSGFIRRERENKKSRRVYCDSPPILFSFLEWMRLIHV